MNMTEDGRDSSPTEVATNSAVNKAPEKKVRNRPLTKIVIRRLPPTMTEEAFLEQVSPVPEYDYFYFTKPDMTLGPCAFSRAYINFVNIEDIYLFKDKFDGYVFVDEKGVEYVGVVEYAPFQRIPKKRRKKDPKSGTIESDPIFQEFLESLNEPEAESREPKLEYSYPVNDGNDKKAVSTPLLDFLASRKNEKKTRDERRRREAERRKPRLDRRNKEGTIKEEEIEEADIKKIKVRDWEKQAGKKNEEEDNYSPKKVNAESRDGKNSASKGKTYMEQWQGDKTKKKFNEKQDSNKGKDWNHDGDKLSRREKREKLREPSREQKTKEVKRYSDTRKERAKLKTDDETSEAKPKTNSDIKPFTQLPKVKTEDLSKVIEAMDRNVNKLSINDKLEDEPEVDQNSEPEIEPGEFENMNNNNTKSGDSKIEAGDNCLSEKESVQRCSSLEADITHKEDNNLRRHRSLEDNVKEDDVDKNEDDSNSQDTMKRAERRIRNKDRPSLAIYQPGMGRFSKQRISKDTDKLDKSDNLDKLETAKVPKDT